MKTSKKHALYHLLCFLKAYISSFEKIQYAFMNNFSPFKAYYCRRHLQISFKSIPSERIFFCCRHFFKISYNHLRSSAPQIRICRACLIAEVLKDLNVNENVTALGRTNSAFPLNELFASYGKMSKDAHAPQWALA